MFEHVALMDLGTPEVLVIFAAVLLIAGDKKLPKLISHFGDTVHIQHRSMSQSNEDKKKQTGTREAADSARD